MALIIPKEHAWGQLPAYSERIIHQLPLKCRYLAFKIQGFLDRNAYFLVPALSVVRMGALLFNSQSRATLLTGCAMELPLGTYYKATSPSFLIDNPSIRGTGADAVLATAAIGIASYATHSSMVIFCGQPLFVYFMAVSQQKHGNALLATYNYTLNIFRKIAPHSAKTLENFKFHHPEASPPQILKAILDEVKLLPENTDPITLVSLFEELEKHLADIVGEDKICMRGTQTHTFLRERLRFVCPILYDCSAGGNGRDPIELNSSPSHLSKIDVPGPILEELIKFFKNPNHSLSLSSLEEALTISRLANSLDIEKFEKECAQFIEQKFDLDNVLYYFETARKGNLEILFLKTIEYLFKNRDNFLEFGNNKDRITVLQEEYDLGCLAFLLDPKDYSEFKFDHADHLILSLSTDSSLSLVLTEEMLDTILMLLNNPMINSSVPPQILILRKCNISNNILFKLYNNPIIKKMQLYNCYIFDGNSKHQTKSFLKSNIYKEPIFDQEEHEQNLDCVAGESLQELTLCECDRFLNTRSTFLRNLKLKGNRSHLNLADILNNNPALETLEISSFSMLVLEGVNIPKTLKTFFISDIPFKDLTFQVLCTILEIMPNLETLNFGNCGLQDQAALHLIQLMSSNKTIKNFNLVQVESNIPPNSFSPKVLQQLQDCAQKHGKIFVYESGKMMTGFPLVVDEQDMTYLSTSPTTFESKPQKTNWLNIGVRNLTSMAARVRAFAHCYSHSKQMPFKAALASPETWTSWSLSLAVACVSSICFSVRQSQSELAILQEIEKELPPKDKKYFNWEHAYTDFERVSKAVKKLINASSTPLRFLVLQMQKSVLEDLNYNVFLNNEKYSLLSDNLDRRVALCNLLTQYFDLVRKAIHEDF